MLKPLPRPNLAVIAHNDQRSIKWFEDITVAVNAAVLPVGGGTGQALVKLSAADFDYGWGTVAGLTPVANNTLLGNISGGVALPVGLTVAQIKTLLAYTPGDIGAQVADAGLTSIAGASSVGSIYYLSAPDTWSPVTIGANLTFSAGTLAGTGGGGGGATGGAAVLDFGTVPGGNVAELAVTGQAAITAGARVKAWIMGEASASFNAYEHATVLAREIGLAVTDVVAGVGFTIMATTGLRLTGNVNVRWEWS